MKTNKGLKTLVLAIMIFSAFALAGCGGDQSGNTIDEPEITTDYLHGEYSDQLMTDGAVTMLGSVDITQDGESYIITVTEKEVVANSGYEEGYYIADTNITKEASLGLYSRMTCVIDGEEQVVDADTFMENSSDDPDTLYTVFFMGDSAELVLATDPADVMIE